MRQLFGPEAYALADWRLRIATLYADLRAISDGRAGWDHWVATRSDLFKSHPMSPLSSLERSEFSKIAIFDYDPTLRFAVGLVRCDGQTFSVDLGEDGKLKYRHIATTDGLMSHLSAELNVYWIEGYGGGLFLPFGDATNGDETYGGGRYLIDAIKGADLGLDEKGKLILDFNFAYNPSCALSERFICPLAPPENRLTVPVRAGETVPV